MENVKNYQKIKLTIFDRLDEDYIIKSAYAYNKAKNSIIYKSFAWDVIFHTRNKKAVLEPQQIIHILMDIIPKPLAEQILSEYSYHKLGIHLAMAFAAYKTHCLQRLKEYIIEPNECHRTLHSILTD